MSLHEGNLASRFPKIAFVLQKLNSAMKEEGERLLYDRYTLVAYVF